MTKNNTKNLGIGEKTPVYLDNSTPSVLTCRGLSDIADIVYCPDCGTTSQNFAPTVKCANCDKKSISKKNIEASDGWGERSRLTELQDLIQQRELTDILTWLEKRGYVGDTALFLLGWVGYEAEVSDG